MATTTNYGWTTPNDTDLVKDGAAAIRTLGSSIDTTTKALNPSTTLGDVEYRSATANTNTRLPIGTSGQVLAVNGSGVPAWTTISTGGMTLLSTTTLSGTSTTISSINQTYNSLFFVISNTNSSAAGYTIFCLPNNSSSISFAAGCVNSTATNYSSSAIRLSGNQANLPQGAEIKSYACQIDNYTSSTVKPIQHYGHSSTGSAATVNFAGGINTSSPITSLVFTFDGATMTAGTVLLYGVK